LQTTTTTYSTAVPGLLYIYNAWLSLLHTYHSYP
jgi:hypothetical protein